MDVRHGAVSEPTQKLWRVRDKALGLVGAIVIHSVESGIAAGGCRFLPYACEDEAVRDAWRLARTAAYTNIMAGLPFGGGKAVLHKPKGRFDRRALFRALGEAVARIEGRFIVTPGHGAYGSDMEEVGRRTRFVTGLAARPGRAGGDPAPWTAMGVFLALQEAARHVLGHELDGATVAVQGVGKVGGELARLLRRAGARLIIADFNESRAGLLAAELAAKAVDPSQILSAKADILVPCALGGVLNANTIPEIRARIVCGAASNQLGRDADDEALAAHGIVYAPDYLVNAGGMINSAAEYLGESREAVIERICAIPERLSAVLSLAESTGTAPGRVASQMAENLLAEGTRLRPATS